MGLSKETQSAYVISTIRPIHTLEFISRVWLHYLASRTSPHSDHTCNSNLGNGPLHPLVINLFPAHSQCKRGVSPAMNTTLAMF